MKICTVPFFSPNFTFQCEIFGHTNVCFDILDCGATHFSSLISSNNYICALLLFSQKFSTYQRRKLWQHLYHIHSRRDHFQLNNSFNKTKSKLINGNHTSNWPLTNQTHLQHKQLLSNWFTCTLRDWHLSKYSLLLYSYETLVPVHRRTTSCSSRGHMRRALTHLKSSHCYLLFSLYFSLIKFFVSL